MNIRCSQKFFQKHEIFQRMILLVRLINALNKKTNDIYIVCISHNYKDNVDGVAFE